MHQLDHGDNNQTNNRSFDFKLFKKNQEYEYFIDIRIYTSFSARFLILINKVSGLTIKLDFS